MKRLTIERSGVDRRGIVLILALGMLTLFSIVAVTLASISRTQATAAANFKRQEQFGAGQVGLRQPEVEGLFRFAMNQLIYDTRNPQSAIRGHSLLRDMYGSPEKYSATRSGAMLTNINGLAGVGAELRLSKDDLKRLYGLALNPSTDNDPRLAYQGAYNGTGMFLPRKTDFPATLTDFNQLRLSKAEIALQSFFMQPPEQLAPRTWTNLPRGSATDMLAVMQNPNAPAISGNYSYFLPAVPLNYTVFDRLDVNVNNFRAATLPLPDGSLPEPERFMFWSNDPAFTTTTYGADPRGPSAGGGAAAQYGDYRWFGADEDYDYPDINNMFLAMERADGTIVIPSFHRPGVIGDVADGIWNIVGGVSTLPGGVNYRQMPWLTAYDVQVNNLPSLRRLVLRPRSADYDATTLGFATPKAGRFREMADTVDNRTVPTTPRPGQDGIPDDIDGSGFIGDHPSELDVDTDGDGLNDSIWIDLGYPPIQVADATVKPLFAFKVVDLDSKVNLNVHGNLVRAFDGTNYYAMHTSNLGASPTEINPQHVMVLGDVPNVAAYSNSVPNKPVWEVTDNANDGPYRRMVRGSDVVNTRGKWSIPAEDASSIPAIVDTNGSGVAPDYSFNSPGVHDDEGRGNILRKTSPGVSHFAGDDNGNVPFDYDDGIQPRENLFTGETLKRQSAMGPSSPVDFAGVGRKFAPWSRTLRETFNLSAAAGINQKRTDSSSSDYADLFGLVLEEPNLLGGFLNYPHNVHPTDAAVKALGAHLLTVFDDQDPATSGPAPAGIGPIISGGVPLQFTAAGRRGQYANFAADADPTNQQPWRNPFTVDEASEINPYRPNEDDFFSVADLEALLRSEDAGSATLYSRLAQLAPDQLGHRSVGVGTAQDVNAGVVPNFLTRELFAKRRMRHMVTHESWDLIRFNNPPTFAKGPYVMGAGMPTDSGSLMRELPTLAGTEPPVEQQLTRESRGKVHGLSPSFNGAELFEKIDAGITANASSPAVELALENLATTGVDGSTGALGGTTDTLIPAEVQMGRRFDLNRPLTSYAQNPAQADRDRTQMARQLYVLLSISSGAVGPLRDATGTNITGVALQDPKVRLAQARVLAQLAVNIVDYIDNDNTMTVMTFDPDLSDGWTEPDTNMNNAIDSGDGQDIVISGQTALTISNVDEKRASAQVIGFELPDLVISEALAVGVETKLVGDPVGTGEPMTGEDRVVMNLWAELQNPWPDQGGNGVTLFGTYPIFVLGASDPTTGGGSNTPVAWEDIHKSILGPNETDSWSANLQGVVGSEDPLANGRMFVTFDANDAVTGTPVGQVVPSRIAPGAGLGTPPIDGHFVIGPADWNTEIKENVINIGGAAIASFQVPETAPTNIFPYAEHGLSQTDNNYTARDFRFVRSELPLSNFTYEMKLYRLRDPNQPPSAATNPYVVVDYVEVSTLPRFPAQNHVDRNRASGTVGTGGSQSDPYGGAVGEDSAGGYILKAGLSATNTFYSLQRRQPWHGYNSEWRPYPTTHPLVGNAFLPNTNLEGLFLGAPSLAESGSDNAIANLRNGMRTSGFEPVLARSGGGVHVHTLNAQTYMFSGTNPPNKQTRRNDNDLDTYVTFPFANRQLANPLELLNVRLYGSHLWQLAAGGVTTHEWRLRFTDDFEFASYPFSWNTGATTGANPNQFMERVWRSRQVPWYVDNRLAHPAWPNMTHADLQTVFGASPNTSSVATQLNRWGQLPLPNLYRFFEMVECRSRILDSPRVTADTVHDSTKNTGAEFAQRDKRMDRVPGKINLNNVTEDEVFKALVDSVSAMYVNIGDWNTAIGAYTTAGGILPASLTNSDVFWPINYASSLVTPLGEFPLATTAVTRQELWSKTIPLHILTTSASPSSAGGVPSIGTVSSTSSVIDYSGYLFTTAAVWGASANAPGLITAYPFGGGNIFALGSPHRQWPGILDGPDLTNGTYPGTDPRNQVTSELFRELLLSRAGADGITGTADDKPFRSFASDDVADTILRPRNTQALDFVPSAQPKVDNTGVVNIGDLEVIRTLNQVQLSMASDSTEDVLNITNYVDLYGATVGVDVDGGGVDMNVAMGDYVARLGGQFTPRLFDPIPNPFVEDAYQIRWFAAAPPDLGLVVGTLGSNPFDGLLPYFGTEADTIAKRRESYPIDHWMLEERRNEVLAKIGGNVTTRSHVFAVWVTVGFFRVEPGTETLKVPLLGSEVGAEVGRPVRHRAFFVIDRSQAKTYEYDDIDADFDLERLREREILEFYKIIE